LAVRGLMCAIGLVVKFEEIN